MNKTESIYAELQQEENYDKMIRGRYIFLVPKEIKFDCTGCSNCCRLPYVGLSDYEIKKIKKYIQKNIDLKKKVGNFLITKPHYFMDDQKIPATSLTGYYIRKVPCKEKKIGSISIQEKCIFLSDDNKCCIYPARPLKCKEYPFNHTLRSGVIYKTSGKLEIGIAIDKLPNEEYLCNGFRRGKMNINMINNLISIFETEWTVLLNHFSNPETRAKFKNFNEWAKSMI